MRSKTATGKAMVTTEPDEHRHIHWEAFLEAQHPPSRKGEKPSDSCSAKCCGHWQKFCSCPRNVSLPHPHAHPWPSGFSLRTHSQGKRRESSSAGTLALPLQRRPHNNAHEPNQLLSLCPHPSVESHSVVMMFLETPLSWLKTLHLQITAFWTACKEVGRADDNIELKLAKSQVLAGWLLDKSLQRATLILLHPQHTHVTSLCSGGAHHCLLTFLLL